MVIKRWNRDEGGVWVDVLVGCVRNGFLRGRNGKNCRMEMLMSEILVVDAIC